VVYFPKALPPHGIGKQVTGAFRHLASGILHLASGIWHPTSGILHLASGIRSCQDHVRIIPAYLPVCYEINGCNTNEQRLGGGGGSVPEVNYKTTNLIPAMP
jgi:hypothetical protein